VIGILTAVAGFVGSSEVYSQGGGLFGAIINIVLGVLVIIGARKRNRISLGVWLIIQIIFVVMIALILIGVFCAAVGLVEFKCSDLPPEVCEHGPVVAAVAFGIVFVLYTYLWAVVYSLFKELGEGGAYAGQHELQPAA